ncbi:MAG: hypothetical protein CMJ33_09300 [Phycisphaerae bacterium]|nr:hypothetical protein [Phycisphaerae bacterium]HAW95701.1 hypothetical protein [Phycisphaerales bacterium]
MGGEEHRRILEREFYAADTRVSLEKTPKSGSGDSDRDAFNTKKTFDRRSGAMPLGSSTAAARNAGSRRSHDRHERFKGGTVP